MSQSPFKAGKVPSNFSLEKCTEDSLKKIAVRDLRAIMHAEHLPLHGLKAPKRKKSYIERILRHRDEKQQQKTSLMAHSFAFEPGNQLIAVYKQNEAKLQKEATNCKTLNMKLSTLQELKISNSRIDTSKIEDALTVCLPF